MPKRPQAPDSLELDVKALTRGLTFLAFHGSIPERDGPAAWAQICAARGLDPAKAHVLTSNDIEEAFHTLGPWSPSERCHCGWRTSELWRRLRTLAAGETPLTMIEEARAYDLGPF